MTEYSIKNDHAERLLSLGTAAILTGVKKSLSVWTLPKDQNDRERLSLLSANTGDISCKHECAIGLFHF